MYLDTREVHVCATLQLLFCTALQALTVWDTQYRIKHDFKKLNHENNGITILPAACLAFLLLNALFLGSRGYAASTEVNKLAATAVTAATAESLAPIQPLTEAEVQKALDDMRSKMLKDLDTWSSQLKRSDFKRQGGQLSLKQIKQLELCQIFQKTIDETYVLAKNNRHRMNAEEKAIVDNRAKFLQILGFKNNVIATKLGFDCRIH